MSKIYITDESFVNDQGNTIKYKSLCVSGSINGKVFTLKKTLSANEAMIAELLLDSKEELATNTRSANDDELDEFFKKNSGRSSDKIELTEE